MSKRLIQKRLRDNGIAAVVEKINVPKDRRTEYSCQYKITFPPLSNTEYCVEVIDKYDAYCRIEDYLELRGNGGGAAIKHSLS